MNSHGRNWFLKVGAAALVIAAVLFSCAGVRRIAPLEPGESSIHLSLGGPFTEVGSMTIPLPLLAVGYNYGLIDKLDIESGLHLTSLLYKMAHVDIGVNWRPIAAAGLIPGIILSPRLFFISNFSATRLYPNLDLTLWWQPHTRLRAYTGIQNWFEAAQERTDGLPQDHHWLIAPYIGTEWGVGKWQFQVEGKVYTPNLRNSGRPTKNIGFGDYGVLGVFVGVSRSIGGSN